jgi:hypothetical protein
MNQRRRAPPLTKAELRAECDRALSTANKPVIKLPTKVIRKCGRCGESTSVMVESGHAPPEFKCESCDSSFRKTKRTGDA